MAIREHEFVDEGIHEAVPYGTGLALLVDEAVEELANGLVLRIEVRDGRPQLVAIESPDSDHPITKRSLSFPVRKLVKTIIRDATVRVERDAVTGEDVGLRIRSATGAGDVRSQAERVADADATASPQDRDAPASLTTSSARSSRSGTTSKRAEAPQASSLALGTTLNHQPFVKWMFKARARGLA